MTGKLLAQSHLRIVCVECAMLNTLLSAIVKLVANPLSAIAKKEIWAHMFVAERAHYGIRIAFAVPVSQIQ